MGVFMFKCTLKCENTSFLCFFVVFLTKAACVFSAFASSNKYVSVMNIQYKDENTLTNWTIFRRTQTLSLKYHLYNFKKPMAF